jgi:hypothetical protein
VLNLFICTSCGCALTSSSYRHHLKEREQIKVNAHVKRSIDSIGMDHNICADYPTIDMSAGPVPFMAGLQVQYKYGCPIPTCMYTAAKPRIRDHLKKDHQNNNGSPLENVACQVLNSGAAPTNIRITLPKPQDDDEDSVSQSDFETYDVNTSITLSAPDDQRLISPWLLRTGFHKYVEGKNTPDLMKLCSMPSPTEDHMSGLQEIVYEYFQSATTLIEKTDPLILQLLNSSDPQKE